MKKNILLGMMVASMATLGFTSCTKSDNGNSTTNIETASSQALTDFVNTLAEPTYAAFVTKATTLNNAVQALVSDPTDANQTAAQAAWRDVRITWEQSEGFLLGPVEDNSYDPYMDTWPTDKNQINTLLNGTQDIATLLATPTAETDEGAEYALRGFHPLEYLLWDFKAADYNQRDKDYMSALAQDILNITKELQNSWTKSGGYANELLNPGSTGSRYTNKEGALEDIALKLIDICNEVGESKMPTPFKLAPTAPDSTLTESPYSHNSIADFKNNIQGALNSYTCAYGNNKGTSLSTLVQINNRNLDNNIKSAFATVISSFDAFSNTTFEKAIYGTGTGSNPAAVNNTIKAIEDLKDLLEGSGGLVEYIQTYVKD